MCGRFTIMMELDEMREQLELGESQVEYEANTNVTPGTSIPVVIDSNLREVRLYKWGLVPGWAKDPAIGYKMINARAETIDQKPSFKGPFNCRRCLIPADGFYEWKAEGNRKFPYLFTLLKRKPFTFAGIWDHWQDKLGNELYSCSIITTEPNALVAEYHNRMPVILDETNRWGWLDNQPAEELKKLLTAYPAEKMAVPVRIPRLV